MASIQSATAKSIRPFRSSEEYLVAMKEDLAEWLNELYGLGTGLDRFLRDLETGSVLCQHANTVSQVARDFCQDYPELGDKMQLPRAGVSYTAAAQPGTFLARDNIANFIQWCRRELQIKDVLMFETEDLVLRKNEKNFVLCLLEVARRASKFGMLAPVLIQMEEEIEEEIREEMDLPAEVISPKPKPQRQLCDFKNLDEMVCHLVSRCTCPEQFPMVKVSEGKYKVGDSNTLIFVRILRKHVMVRVGGGWDTLEHYLDKHDPCRCTSLTHKQMPRFSSPHRTAMPTHEIKARLPTRTDQPNKPQTALILSRSQSPMPPVEWRLASPSAPSLRNHKAAPQSPSADVPVTSGDNSDKRNPWDRQRDQSATPSCQIPTSINSGKANSSLTAAARTGREKTRAFPVSYSTAQESKGSALSVVDKSKVPSHCFVPQQSENRMSHSWVNTQSVPSKIDQSSSDMNKQSSGTSTQAHKAASEMSSVIAKGMVRSHSPAPSQQCKLQVSQSVEQDTLPLSPSTMDQDVCWQDPSSLRKPSVNGSKNPNLQKRPIRSRTPDPYSLNNNNNKEMSTSRGKASLLTLPPLHPMQESELYRCFEDEIVSNMKALGLCLLGENLGEAEPNECSSPAKMASSPKQKEDQKLNVSPSKYSISPLQAGANHINNGNRYSGCGNEASSPSSKLIQHDSGFGDVLTELVSGAPSLNHVDIENWIAKTSLEMVPCDSSAGLQPTGLDDLETSKPLSDRATDQSSNKLGSTCDQRRNSSKGSTRKDMPVSQNAMTTLELNSLSTNEGSDTNSSFDCPIPSYSLLKTRVQQGKQKRSLRKPERVPSIYKLKLRPKIRPRRDNRPEKKPSRIPTPLSYRQEDKALKSTTKSGSSHKAFKANSRVVGSHVQGKQKSSLKLTQPEDFGLGEDCWLPQHMNSRQGRTLEKQFIKGDTGQGNEDKGSWV